jgi:uncharacterized membrane protein
MVFAAPPDKFDISNSYGSPWGVLNNFTLGKLASTFLSNAVAIAGVIMFVLILIGGVGFMMSAGKNDPQSAAKSKTLLTSAVLGFIIVFAAYWIIQIIEAITGVEILNSPL